MEKLSPPNWIYTKAQRFIVEWIRKILFFIKLFINKEFLIYYFEWFIT